MLFAIGVDVEPKKRAWLDFVVQNDVVDRSIEVLEGEDAGMVKHGDLVALHMSTQYQLYQEVRQGCPVVGETLRISSAHGHQIDPQQDTLALGP